MTCSHRFGRYTPRAFDERLRRYIFWPGKWWRCVFCGEPGYGVTA